MKEKPSEYQVILASRSPSRAQLLRDAGIAFTVMPSPFEDPPQPEFLDDESPEELAVHLATRKADALWQTLNPERQADSVVLAADTIALSPARQHILGKPTTVTEACIMLRTFRSTAHDVITGVCLRFQNRTIAFEDVATVKLGYLSDDDINRYLDKNEWQGKAGGYNLTDRLEAGWPIETTGDPSTVIGLPMRRLIEILRHL